MIGTDRVLVTTQDDFVAFNAEENHRQIANLLDQLREVKIRRDPQGRPAASPPRK
jgi:hypothetical protein